MYIVCVHVRVKSEYIDEFRVATEDNAKKSMLAQSIHKVFHNCSDVEARRLMSVASLFSGRH